MQHRATFVKFLLVSVLVSFVACTASAQWKQLQGSAGRSGSAPSMVIPTDLGLLAAVPATDAIFAAPVIADGRVFVVDGSGVVIAMDATSQQVLWTHATRGGKGNCNNVAAPAVTGKYLHVGTTAGYYYVFEAATGKVIREIDCREPIFSAPAVGNGRVYFATLGARIYCGAAGRRIEVDVGLRQGGHRFHRRQMAGRRLGQVSWRPRQLEGPFRLLSRH